MFTDLGKTDVIGDPLAMTPFPTSIFVHLAKCTILFLFYKNANIDDCAGSDDSSHLRFEKDTPPKTKYETLKQPFPPREIILY